MRRVLLPIGAPAGGGGGGGGAGALFHSDWSTATGTSDAAIRDTGKAIPWTEYNNFGGANLLSVVAATGLGFPAGMANVLRAEYQGSSAGDVTVIDQWPVPAVGQHLYFRAYVRVAIPASAGAQNTASHHPVQPQSGACASNTWNLKIGLDGAGKHDLLFLFGSTPSPDTQFGPGMIFDINTTYRVEWHFERVSTTGWQVQVRVYDASNTLVADDGDFVNDLGQPLTGKTITIPSGDLACMGRLFVGNNGPSWTVTGHPIYWGGVMVRDDTWAGPY